MIVRIDHSTRWITQRRRAVIVVVLSLFFACVMGRAFGQDCQRVNGATIAKCSDALRSCAPVCVDFSVGEGCSGSMNLTHWFDLYLSVPGNINVTFTCATGHTALVKFVGPFVDGVNDDCTSVQAAVGSAPSSSFPLQISNAQPGHYFFTVQVMGPCISSSYELGLSGDIACEEGGVDCAQCYVQSYSPTPGTRFTLTAWAKDEDAPPGTLNYTDPFIEIDFGTCCNPVVCEPDGQIIDGWQRIHQVVDIPAGAPYMVINLRSADGDVLFDDIRVQPDDASMKCYAYDPVTTRLVAEFDERHYATRYEYDQEGRLNRIKKETERGVMTIQEGRMSMPTSP